MREGVGMSDEKMREEFEAWAADFHIGAPLTWYEYDGVVVYEDWDVQNTWRAWKASRAALVVELPEKISQYNTDATGLGSPAAAEHDEAIDDCRAAIEAAGVRVKQ